MASSREEHKGKLLHEGALAGPGDLRAAFDLLTRRAGAALIPGRMCSLYLPAVKPGVYFPAEPWFPLPPHAAGCSGADYRLFMDSSEDPAGFCSPDTRRCELQFLYWDLTAQKTQNPRIEGTLKSH